MKVLVIDREPPIYPRHGNALIAMEVFRRLRDVEVTLIAPVSPADQDQAMADLATTFSDIHLVPRQRWTPAIAGSMEPPLVDTFGRFPGLDMSAARQMATTIRQVVLDRAFDVLHVRQLPMAGYRRFAGRTPSLLELVDSETLGTERTVPQSLRTSLRSWTARFVESRAVHGFDVVTTVADADAERLRRLSPDSRIEVVPNGVDADRFASLVSVERDPATLVFLGAMSFPPNVAAMVWFGREVLPLVRQERPETRLVIVGRDPSPTILKLGEMPGVEVTGEVADVRPYLSTATIFVAPMVSGSGIKNKVLEALAASCPVVATPIAVDGLPTQDGEHLVIADTAVAYARAVLDVLAKPLTREALGRAGRDLVTTQFTWDRCASRYEGLYQELAGSPSRT